ncbi:MAG: glycosyltransferase family 1 protein [Nitrospirales bacterium]
MRTTTPTTQADLICLSHLRWNFVFQRPQHLMSRFARQRRVFYIEEPVFDGTRSTIQDRTCPQSGVEIITPHIPESSRSEAETVMASLVADFLHGQHVRDHIAWFYTPMAVEFCSECPPPQAIVYDCMDELSLFRGAPARMCANEERLLQAADLVFTGGVSLFEAKRDRHPRTYAFPSSVDVAHFARARSLEDSMPDQQSLPHPRLGYAGVIDERLDLDLIGEVARRRPEWRIVMLGPVVKIDPATLPQENNIHWLGMKDYLDLPRYFAGWDVGILPFAMNDSTRFISPTKTPEYLAAGLPVVSTPIRDVVRPYGTLGLARIAANADEFIAATEQALAHGMSFKWRERADAYLQTLSWDKTWGGMDSLIAEVLQARQKKPVTSIATEEVLKAAAAHV